MNVKPKNNSESLIDLIGKLLMQYMKLYEMRVVLHSLNFEDIPRVIGVKFFTFY